MGFKPRTRPTPEPSVGEFMAPLPFTIDATLSLAEAYKRMREHRIRHLPVTSDGVLVGIVSIHDLHLIETLSEIDPHTVPVQNAMTDRPVLVSPDEPLRRVAGRMIDRKIGSVLVVEDGELRGIFTTIDALRALRRAYTRPYPSESRI